MFRFWLWRIQDIEQQVAAGRAYKRLAPIFAGLAVLLAAIGLDPLTALRDE